MKEEKVEHEQGGSMDTYRFSWRANYGVRHPEKKKLVKQP